MKNKILLLLFILPLISGAQQSHPAIFKDGIPNNFQLKLHATGTNTSAKLLDDTYYLSGTRRDTFDIPSSVFNKVDSSQYLYSIDDSTLLSYVQLVNDPDTGWINSTAHYYSYDAQKNDTLDLLVFWDYVQGAWSNQQRTVNAFDANQNITSTTVYNWNAGNYWENTSRIENSYDAVSNLLQTVLFNINVDGVTWDSSYKFVYTYDANNNQVTETDYWFTGGSFTPTNLFTTTFNAANYETQRTGQYWDDPNWKKDWRDSLSYDANNNVIVYERRRWHQGSYSLTDTKYEYTYNGLNQLTGRTDYNSDPDQVTYLLAYNYAYEYNVHGNLSHEIEQRYNDALAIFQNAEQTFYYYTTIISGVNTLPTDNAYRCKLYPNPAEDILQVAMHMQHDSNIELEVTNLSGQMVSGQSYTLKAGDNKFNLDVSMLPAGIYSVRIFNPEAKAQSVNRFVKE